MSTKKTNKSTVSSGFYTVENCISTELKEVAKSNLVLISVSNWKDQYKRKCFQIVINHGGKCFGDYSSNSFFYRDITEPMGCKSDGSIIIGVPNKETVMDFLRECENYKNECHSKISDDPLWANDEAIANGFILTVKDFLEKGYYETESTEDTESTEKTEDTEDTENKIYAICKKIMDNQTAEIFKPSFYNKKGILLVKKFAKREADSITDRLFEDCRKPSYSMENDKRINALTLFFKSLFESGKITNGFEIGLNKLSNMFVSWTDNKFTFNLRDENDLRIIGFAIAISVLKGYVPNGKMFKILLNRDNSKVVRLTDFVEGFYSWKVEKVLTEQEQKEKQSKEIEKTLKLLETLTANLTNTEKMDIQKQIDEILKIQKVGAILKKNKKDIA